MEIPRKPEASIVGLRKQMPAKLTERLLLGRYCSLLNSKASPASYDVPV